MGVRTPVVSMSMRFLMGMTQAFVVPGICSRSFISATSSSQERRSGHRRRRSVAFSHSGAHPEYHLSFARHSAGGRSVTTVSIMESGAGSVEVSARPAFPCTRSTSGNVLSRRSWTCRSRLASVTEMPGSVIGM